MAYKDSQVRRKKNEDYYRREKERIVVRRKQLMQERGKEILARRRFRYAQNKQFQVDQDEAQRAKRIQETIDAAIRRALDTPGNRWLLQVAILTAHSNPIEEERKKLAA